MSRRKTKLGLTNLADRTFLGRPRTLYLPEVHGNRHILLSGTSGAGKTTILMSLLEQVRKESVVISDPEGEYASRFYDADRGDVILNPLDQRAAYFNPGDEVNSYDEALSLAKSFFPSEDQQSDAFFHPAAAKILAALLTFKPLPEELSQWMMDPEELEKRVRMVGNKMLLGERAPEQSSGVIGTLQTRADSFRFLIPSTESKGRKTWNSRQWAENPRGWIFLTSSPHVHDSLVPLNSFWFDLIIMRLRCRPEGGSPVWCVLDELASLQYLPQLHGAVTMGRRADIRVIMGLQHRKQLNLHFGDHADPILAMPDLKIYLRAGDFNSADWASENIGEVEIERIASSWNENRKSETERSEALTRRLVLPSEIQALPNCHGYLQYPGHLVRLQVPHRSWPRINPVFVARKQSSGLMVREEIKVNADDNRPLDFYR